MDFTSIVETRRNIREFANRPLPEPVLRRILEAGRSASSAFNLQPWRFVVVRQPETIARLAGMCRGQTFVGEAAAVVVCCGRKYQNSYTWLAENLYLIDVAIAIDHLQLAARNEGVGSCWIAVFEPEAVKTLLEVPADHDVVMLLPLGYPLSEADFHPSTDRLPLSQIAFVENFGKEWPDTCAPPEPPRRACQPLWAYSVDAS